VNVTQPGILPTDMQREALGESVPESLIAFHPIRRIATLEEVAAMVRYLAGPQGGYITGGIMDIAGGLSTTRVTPSESCRHLSHIQYQ
jgi:NAD(P)-dependent dehydrogenase (short-subunit alcohol dehydrogenase family)